MPRKVLLVSMLVVCLAAFGQTGTTSSNTESPTSSNPIAIPTYAPVPIGNGLALAGGTVGYYGEGPAGGVLLSTPTASFDSPLPTAGISMAGRAGISDSTPFSAGVQSTASNSTLVYSNIPPEISAIASPATSTVSSGKTGYDLLPSFFSDKIGQTGSNTGGLTLAQIADRYRSLATTMTVRTYTNADVRPAGNASATENALLASNRPPVLPQAAGAPHASGNQPAPAQEVASQSSAGQNQSQSVRENELPASASPLPLLALLGVTSMGLSMFLWGSSRRALAPSVARKTGAR